MTFVKITVTFVKKTVTFVNKTVTFVKKTVTIQFVTVLVYDRKITLLRLGKCVKSNNLKTILRRMAVSFMSDEAKVSQCYMSQA